MQILRLFLVTLLLKINNVAELYKNSKKEVIIKQKWGGEILPDK